MVVCFGDYWILTCVAGCEAADNICHAFSQTVVHVRAVLVSVDMQVVGMAVSEVVT